MQIIEFSTATLANEKEKRSKHKPAKKEKKQEEAAEGEGETKHDEEAQDILDFDERIEDNGVYFKMKDKSAPQKKYKPKKQFMLY